jgi:hypothetical protein
MRGRRRSNGREDLGEERRETPSRQNGELAMKISFEKIGSQMDQLLCIYHRDGCGYVELGACCAACAPLAKNEASSSET